jgi:hypothetical protein
MLLNFALIMRHFVEAKNTIYLLVKGNAFFISGYFKVIQIFKLKSDWRTLVSRINVENGIKLRFVFE